MTALMATGYAFYADRIWLALVRDASAYLEIHFQEGQLTLSFTCLGRPSKDVSIGLLDNIYAFADLLNGLMFQCAEATIQYVNCVSDNRQTQERVFPVPSVFKYCVRLVHHSGVVKTFRYVVYDINHHLRANAYIKVIISSSKRIALHWQGICGTSFL